MNVLVSYLFSTGGSLASNTLLLQTMARSYPADRFHIVSSSNNPVIPKLEGLANVEILPQTDIIHREVNRWLLGNWRLEQLARQTRADLLWSMNIGTYHRVPVPQLLTITNSFQVRPWDEVKDLATKGKLHLGVQRWTFRRSLPHADRVVVQSPHIATCVREALGFPGPIDVIPKSVETDEDIGFDPMDPAQVRRLARAPGSEEAFTFLYMASPEVHKNHPLLVRTARLLRERGLPIRIALSLSEPELERLGGDEARASIRSGHLVPLGWSERARIKSVYDACDACVMPSLLESQSSAHLEAMRWEKPQISADLPYAHDLCGDSSLYADPRDAADWADKMVRLSQDADLRRRLVAEGHVQMGRLPARWKDVAERYHAVIEETIADWGQPRERAAG